MHAIPTRYAGTQFRSRLEARWAAMFDLLAWRWDYEPIDLAGYIPDFIISLQTPVLVEVRPIWGFCEKTAQRVANSAWEGDVLIAGCRPKHTQDPTDPEDYWSGVWVHSIEKREFFGSNTVGRPLWQCYSEPAVFECDGGHLGIAAAGGYGCLICAPGVRRRRVETALDYMWREAGNRVQWRAPR